jgi:hypothetical protein
MGINTVESATPTTEAREKKISLQAGMFQWWGMGDINYF